MKRLRGTGTHNSPMNRDRTPAPKPTYHHGSGKPLGVLHEAPTRPQINAANYANQKVKRK